MLKNKLSFEQAKAIADSLKDPVIAKTWALFYKNKITFDESMLALSDPKNIELRDELKKLYATQGDSKSFCECALATITPDAFSHQI